MEGITGDSEMESFGGPIWVTNQVNKGSHFKLEIGKDLGNNRDRIWIVLNFSSNKGEYFEIYIDIQQTMDKHNVIWTPSYTTTGKSQYSVPHRGTQDPKRNWT